MHLFQKKSTVLPIPSGFSTDSIRMESSICTGETIIGFYDPIKKHLYYAELVKSQADIQGFYLKYGLKLPDLKES